MSGQICFALLINGKEHETRRVNLKSPVVLIQQPADRRWVVSMANDQDAQSAYIISKMGKQFSITPLDDQAEVTIQKDGSSSRLPTNRAKRLVSERTQIVFSIRR